MILTIVELLPSRWGITDASLLVAGDEGGPVPGRARCGGPVQRSAIGLLLSGWWLVPFGLEHAYSSSMGYTNVEGWAQYFREADAWALVLAGIGAVAAFVTRSRFGITVTVLGIVSAVATAVDPQGSLYNVRLLPLWFISVYFMAAWAFGRGASPWRWAGAEPRTVDGRVQSDPWSEGPLPHRPWEKPGPRASQRWRPATPRRATTARRWGPAAVSGAVAGLLAVMAAVVPPFVLPGVVAAR